MAIRETECRIPNGYSAEFLGEVGSTSNPDVLLISTLSSPLLVHSILEYVVFALSGQNVDQCQWTVIFKSLSGDTFTIPISSEENILRFELPTSEDLFPNDELTMVEVSAIVISDGTIVASLKIEQEITEYHSVVDYLFNAENFSLHNTALVADIRITSELVCYERNLDSAAPETTGDVPASMVAAISYVALMADSFDDRKDQIEELRKLLNGEAGLFKGLFADFMDTPIGICGITPTMARKALGWQEDGLTVDEEKEQKIDLFNLLRFPKSTLSICTMALSKIKGNSQWSDLTQRDLGANEEALSIIASSFAEGDLEVLNEASDEGKKISQLMRSPFFEMNFAGPKLVLGKVMSSENLALNNVRVDVFWEAATLSKGDLDDTGGGYTKDLRVRISTDKLSLFNSKNLNDKAKAGNKEIKVKKWQVFTLLDIEDELDARGNRIIWYKIRYANSEKWIVAFSGGRFADIEKVVELKFDTPVRTNQNGEFELTVFDKGLYFLRAIEDDKPIPGPGNERKGCFDGESGWVIIPQKELMITMEVADSSAKWTKESDLLSVLGYFDETWEYDNGNGRYPFEIKNAGIIASYIKGGAGFVPRTDCSSFVETAVYKAWHDIHNSTITNSQHKYWVNSRTYPGENTDFSSRLDTAVPAIDLETGFKVFAKDDDQATINYPPSTNKFSEFEPSPWTIVQHYNNSYTGKATSALSGHMYFILDYRKNSKLDHDGSILTLESSDADVYYSEIVDNKKDGVQIKHFFHIALLNAQKQDNKYLLTRAWWKNNNVVQWSDLKKKTALILVKMHVYDLRITRPPGRK